MQQNIHKVLFFFIWKKRTIQDEDHQYKRKCTTTNQVIR